MAGPIQVVPLGAGQGAPRVPRWAALGCITVQYRYSHGCSLLLDVGRSCVLVTLGGRTVMFDCGMHMGYNDAVRAVLFMRGAVAEGGSGRAGGIARRVEGAIQRAWGGQGGKELRAAPHSHPVIL